MNTRVVCVWNNREVYEKVVKNNENLKNCTIVDFDNTNENTAITKCYNDFITTKIDENSDFWCLFIHQDFGLMEDTDSVVEKLDKKCMYGAVGMKIFKGIFIGKKGPNQKIGLKRHFKMILGEILQGNNDFNFYKYGKKLHFPTTVDSVDCCCIMMHSSLIRKYSLRFDENLDFHMYAEDLCYGAKIGHKIKTKVVQMECYHMGLGNINEDFQKSAQYLRDKYDIKYIPSTCPN